MSDLDNLMCELFDIRIKKISIINKQMYEKAALLRDKERLFENKICEILLPGRLYDKTKIIEVISNYCLETYGFDYNSSDNDTFKQKVREIKLKQLGIN